MKEKRRRSKKVEEKGTQTGSEVVEIDSEEVEANKSKEEEATQGELELTTPEEIL